MKRLLALVVCMSLAAGDPSAPRIRGVVLDPFGRPLSGARVWLRSANASCLLVPGFSFLNTTTDAAGAFALEQPSEPMELFVEHEGYAAAWTPAGDGAVVRMARPAYLLGTLPENCRLHATLGLRELAAAKSAGRFRLGPLPPGRALTITLDSTGHRRAQRRLTLEEGEQRDFEVPLDPGLSLRGRVTPQAAGIVVRASQGELSEVSAVTDETGAFTLTGLCGGGACVVVLAPGHDPVIRQSKAGEFLQVELSR